MTFGKKLILGHFGYFWPNCQHPFWYNESLVHVFHYSIIIYTKTKALLSAVLQHVQGPGKGSDMQGYLVPTNQPEKRAGNISICLSNLLGSWQQLRVF